VDDVRYIILPGELRKDERLTLSHFKVAMVLGAYSKRHGWTDLTQNDVGEMAGLSRETVCRCVGDLVEWKWVARRKKSKRNQYVYRFIMDRGEECDLEITEPKKQCEPDVTGTVISDLTFNKEDTSTLSQSTSSAGAPATRGAARPSLRKAIRIIASDVSWSKWIEHIEKTGTPEAVAAAEAAGELLAPSRWPSASSPLPNIGGLNVG